MLKLFTIEYLYFEFNLTERRKYALDMVYKTKKLVTSIVLAIKDTIFKIQLNYIKIIQKIKY